MASRLPWRRAPAVGLLGRRGRPRRDVDRNVRPQDSGLGFGSGEEHESDSPTAAKSPGAVGYAARTPCRGTISLRGPGAALRFRPRPGPHPNSSGTTRCVAFGRVWRFPRSAPDPHQPHAAAASRQQIRLAAFHRPGSHSMNDHPPRAERCPGRRAETSPTATRSPWPRCSPPPTFRWRTRWRNNPRHHLMTTPVASTPPGTTATARATPVATDPHEDSRSFEE